MRPGLKKSSGTGDSVSVACKVEVKSHVGTGLFAQDKSIVGKTVGVGMPGNCISQADNRIAVINIDNQRLVINHNLLITQRIVL